MIMIDIFLQIPNWVKDYIDPYEFKAGNITFDSSKLITLPDRTVQHFNQSDYTKTILACTIVNAFRQRCHRVGIVFTTQMMFDVVDFCVGEWYVIGEWWGTSQAMTAVNKYVALKYPEYKTAFITMMYNDPELPKVMLKKHAIGITYRGNYDWDRDRLDGHLDGYSYIPMVYWHRTVMRMETKITVDDSFSFQYYTIEHFNDLVKSGNIYPTVYLWLVDTNLDTENVKKYTKWKIMLETNIANNTIMLTDPRRWTTDKLFKVLLEKDNSLLKTKLAFITSELKKNWL